ncbi:hypothetical protein HBI85_236870 [Parastagonospora nodorum]|nr:hypothetical protein HBI85_236870 [Parastagonospora nodorum]
MLGFANFITLILVRDHKASKIAVIVNIVANFLVQIIFFGVGVGVLIIDLFNTLIGFESLRTEDSIEVFEIGNEIGLQVSTTLSASRRPDFFVTVLNTVCRIDELLYATATRSVPVGYDNSWVRVRLKADWAFKGFNSLQAANNIIRQMTGTLEQTVLRNDFCGRLT